VSTTIVEEGKYKRGVHTVNKPSARDPYNKVRSKSRTLTPVAPDPFQKSVPFGGASLAGGWKDIGNGAHRRRNWL